MCCVSFWCDSLTNNIMSTQYLDSQWLLLSKRKKKEYQTIQDSKLCVHSFQIQFFSFLWIIVVWVDSLITLIMNSTFVSVYLNMWKPWITQVVYLKMLKKSSNTLIKVLVMRFEKESLKYKENRIYKAVSMFYFYLHYEQWRFEFIDDSHQMVQNMMET